MKLYKVVPKSLKLIKLYLLRLSFKDFVKKLSESLNSAIDGFKELSEEWKTTYEHLKKNKSEEDWVNRYFIIDLPKTDEKWLYGFINYNYSHQIFFGFYHMGMIITFY